MAGLLIFVGIGIIFVTLLKMQSRKDGGSARRRRRDGDCKGCGDD